MAWEASIAIMLRENSEEGSYLSLSESQTLGAVPVHAGDDLAAMLIGLFERTEVLIARLQDSLRIKTADQIQEHLDMLRDGTHPLLH